MAAEQWTRAKNCAKKQETHPKGVPQALPTAEARGNMVLQHFCIFVGSSVCPFWDPGPTAVSLPFP